MESRAIENLIRRKNRITLNKNIQNKKEANKNNYIQYRQIQICFSMEDNNRRHIDKLL